MEIKWKHNIHTFSTPWIAVGWQLRDLDEVITRKMLYREGHFTGVRITPWHYLAIMTAR